jgi:hypothetical protein
MNLDELGAQINQNEKQKEVSNTDMLAALIIIQSKLSDIEKSIADNTKIQQKNSQNIINTMETQNKNISAIPVLTANIISAKVNDVAAEINNSTDNITVAAKALNESNATFKTLIYGWCTSMLLALCIIIYLVW